jgi:hypothetical protein
VKYLPPFDLIRRSLTISKVKDEVRVSIPYDDFIRMLKLLLAGTEVDEQWYLQQYDDIRQAIEKGSLKSVKRHFIDDGYFEGRMPYPFAVDEEWYLSQYPDVADGIRKGDIRSAEQHFMVSGYLEGRLPKDVAL